MVKGETSVSGQKKTVLVVDDDPEIRKLLATSFSRLDFAVAQVADVAGNVSAWSAWQCTTTGLDDSALTWDPWTQRSAPGWFERSYSQTTKNGAFLRGVDYRKVRVVGVVATSSSLWWRP